MALLMEIGLLVAVRCVGALTSPIMDCDETFNYWEPLHLLAFGRGLQTWEYSPVFALRTYAYVGLHALLAFPLWPEAAGLAAVGALGMGTLSEGALPASGGSKSDVFFAVRAGLGVASAVAEGLLCSAVRARFGRRAAWLTLLLLGSNAGMFHASVAMLPSSACMLAVSLGYWAWLSDRVLLGLLFGCFGTLLCWPFVALMFVPMGLHALHTRGFRAVLGVALLGSLLFLALPAALDSHLYGRPTLPILNLVRYNALGQGGDGTGADLYGTEPWTFYLHNLALNFNAVAPLALVAPVAVPLLWGFRPQLPQLPQLPVKPARSQEAAGERMATATATATATVTETSRGLVLLYMSGTFCSLALFTSMAHKEERFLSMTYPVLCLCAALTVDCALALVLRGLLPLLPRGRSSAMLRAAFVGGAALLLAASTALSVSRSAGLHVNFFAPIRVFGHLEHALAATPATPATPVTPVTPVTVCVGKEWYRFPSSFFLPEGARIVWLRSGFDGQLPQPYAPLALVDGGSSSSSSTRTRTSTSAVHAHFNDRNQGDGSAYGDLADCDWAVDLDLGAGADNGDLGPWAAQGEALGGREGDSSAWTAVHCEEFLDSERSPALIRSFYVPFFGFSQKRNTYAAYCLLRRNTNT